MLSESGIDLLNQLLTYDPEKRITARAAMNHPWLAESPLPQRPEVPRLPTPAAAAAAEPRQRNHYRREIEKVGVQKPPGKPDERFGDLFAPMHHASRGSNVV